MRENTPKLQAVFTKPSDATAYTSGDLIGNSLTAASVVPLRFDIPHGLDNGRITGAKAVVKPASGNVVITAFDFDLLIFRSTASIPFADAGYPADNGVLTLTEAMYQDLVAVIPFANGAWRNQLGALTAGTVAWQHVKPTTYAGHFSLRGLNDRHLKGLLQAKGAWTPTAIAQSFTIDLETQL